MQPLLNWSHTQTSILIATFDEDDEFVLNETFDSNSHSICNPKRFLIFHTNFLWLQWHITLLFKERIELSKFGQNSTYVYRYKWWFVSIQTLWPAFKLKILTYVSIQRCICIDTYISFLKSWLICIKSCKHDSIHHALSDFLREVSVYRYMQAWFDTQVTLCLWEITFVSIQVIDVSIQIAQNQSEVISGHLYRYTCLCIDT
jgi:hypothetical protein